MEMHGTYLLLFCILTIFLNLGLAFRPHHICFLPHSQVGIGDMKCDQDFERYSYDSKQKKCVLFKFGGCGGNKNNFKDLSNCEEDCMGTQSTSEQSIKMEARTKQKTSTPSNSNNIVSSPKARTHVNRKEKITARTKANTLSKSNNIVSPKARTHVNGKEKISARTKANTPRTSKEKITARTGGKNKK